MCVYIYVYVWWKRTGNKVKGWLLIEFRNGILRNSQDKWKTKVKKGKVKGVPCRSSVFRERDTTGYWRYHDLDYHLRNRLKISLISRRKLCQLVGERIEGSVVGKRKGGRNDLEGRVRGKKRGTKYYHLTMSRVCGEEMNTIETTRVG